jgi:hypothetical protein
MDATLARLTRFVLSVSLCLPVGCSRGGGSSSPPPPGLTGIQIDPASVTLVQGDSIVLAAWGLYSDGSSVLVTATWSTLDTALVQLGGSQGALLVVNTLSSGTATVTASTSGFNAPATITIDPWAIPADPGPVYGCDSAGNVYRYPSAGIPPTLIAAGGGGLGFAYDKALNRLYGSDGANLTWTDPDTGATWPAGTFPADPTVSQGLDVDDWWGVYVQGYASGNVYYFNTLFGLTSLYGMNGGGMVDFAVGPGTQLYFVPLVVGGGSSSRKTSCVMVSMSGRLAPGGPQAWS